MKIKAILMSLFILAGTLNTFAASNVLVKKNVKKVVRTSCTVRVTSGNYDVQITASCDCSKQDACKAAYAAATLFL
jgi:hypothetical protein